MSNYSSLLKHPKWQKKRLEVFERDRWTCQSCHRSLNHGVTLHIHHTRYFPGFKPWEYNKDFLLTLCEDCHAEEENLKKNNDSLYNEVCDCRITRYQLLVIARHFRYFLKKEENKDKSAADAIGPILEQMVKGEEVYDFLSWCRKPIVNIYEEER